MPALFPQKGLKKYVCTRECSTTSHSAVATSHGGTITIWHSLTHTEPEQPTLILNLAPEARPSRWARPSSHLPEPTYRYDLKPEQFGPEIAHAAFDRLDPSIIGLERL
jgi:hypothetical protein